MFVIETTLVTGSRIGAKAPEHFASAFDVEAFQVQNLTLEPNSSISGSEVSALVLFTDKPLTLGFSPESGPPQSTTVESMVALDAGLTAYTVTNAGTKAATLSLLTIGPV